MEIITAVFVLGGLGLIFGLWLLFAQRIFHVETDPRVEQILGILPGINCGACGRAGCQGFAVALVKGDVDVAGCAPGGAQAHEQLAQILGVKVNEKAKTIATLICGGGGACTNKYNYEGVKTCVANEMVLGGVKSCLYGCLGFGDCVRICPFDAIVMGDDDLPKIDVNKCTACKKCIEICPKKVLVLSPANKFYHIKCNSSDKGAVAIRICKVSCIGCGKCVNECPENAITLENNLAIIDYDKCINCSKCYKVCPTKAIDNIMPKKLIKQGVF